MLYALCFRIFDQCVYFIRALIKPHFYTSDYAQGFGGKFGVQQDRQDRSAVGWEHVEKTEKHASQKGKVMHLLCFS